MRGACPSPTSPLRARVGGDLKGPHDLYFSEGPPAGASVLLRASWRFTEQVVAYERRVGDGHLVHIGLGHDPSTYELEGFQKLVQRTLMFVAGREAAPSVGVGLIGYGAIAQAHAASITATTGLRLAGVCA